MGDQYKHTAINISSERRVPYQSNTVPCSSCVYAGPQGFDYIECVRCGYLETGNATRWVPKPKDKASAQAKETHMKASNPKDAIGSTKLNLDLVPSTMTAFAAAAFYEGASKYGAFNWRAAGARASVYRAALGRHMDKWWNGEKCDKKTKIPHLASALACIAIIIDAEACGTLNDDRPPAVDMDAVFAELEHATKACAEHHAELGIPQARRCTIDDAR